MQGIASAWSDGLQRLIIIALRCFWLMMQGAGKQLPDSRRELQASKEAKKYAPGTGVVEK